MLEGYGHTIIGTAFNGQAAIDLFKSFSEKPQIILMDNRMPIKDGIETSIEILKIYNNSKIIFATADKNIRNEALEIGVFSVINKPYNFEELFNSICRAITNTSIENT